MSADLPKPADWLQQVISVKNKDDRDELMLKAFELQYNHNPVYQRFCQLVGKTPVSVSSASSIPYLPISFFKSEVIRTGKEIPAGYFKSSGTTGALASRHYYNDLSIYDTCCIDGFESFYGPLENYCVLALLPSYLEQGSSSLVYMVKRWMEKSGHPDNGFFLNNTKQLFERLTAIEKAGRSAILIGVSYALLDLAEQYPMKLASTIVMETGGMKGRRQEMVRVEVHDILKRAFSLSSVHSEYGMTELFSQAYSKGDGIFHSPPWMKVMMREEDDPFGEERTSGVIYIADLANIHSCCFIATEDRGKIHPDGSFEVLGRLDNSDIRGCSLMYDSHPRRE
jgi:hypothetical protein